MSEAIAAPAAPAASEPAKPAPAVAEKPAQPAPEPTNPSKTDPSAAPLKPNKAEVRKNAAQALREHFDASKAKPAERPEPKEPKPEEPAKEAAQRAADGKFAPKAGDAPAEPPKAEQPAAEKPPAPQPPKPDADHEIKLARAVRQLNDKVHEVETHKRQLAEAKGELAKLQKKLEAGKANPLDVLEELGWDYGKLTEAVVARKVQPRAQRMELPEEYREKLERLEASEKRREQEAQHAALQKQRAADTQMVRGYIEQNAERYPFASAVEWGAATVVDQTMRANGKDAEPHLQALERALAKDAAVLIGNERAVRALLASNPKLRETLTSALGVSTSNGQAAASNGAENGSAGGPRSIANLPSGETATPPDKQSKAQLKREAVRAWRERQQTG